MGQDYLCAFASTERTDVNHSSVSNGLWECSIVLGYFHKYTDEVIINALDVAQPKEVILEYD